METVSLVKNETLSIKKGLSQLKVQVNWEENRNSSGHDFDIDLLVLETDSNSNCVSSRHLVFFGSVDKVNGKLTDPEKAVIHSGDDRTGAGDGEECVVNINNLRNDVAQVYFVANIYDAHSRRQTFSQIKSAEVKIFEGSSSTASAVYELTADYRNDTLIVAAKLQKTRAGQWEFVAIGEGSNEYLATLLNRFGIGTKENNI